MATRLTPTGESRPSLMPCISCGQMIDGPGAEYLRVEVLDTLGRVIFKTMEPIRRHFLNDSHAVTMLTIDHKPKEFVKSF